MTVYRAGSGSAQYKHRCDYELRCICYQRGDRNVFVDDNGPYCLIIDREPIKVEFEDMGVQSTTIEAVWLKSDCLPIKKKSVLVSGGDKYKVSETPVDQCDGWVSAKLKLTCEC